MWVEPGGWLLRKVILEEWFSNQEPSLQGWEAGGNEAVTAIIISRWSVLNWRIWSFSSASMDRKRKFGHNYSGPINTTFWWNHKSKLLERKDLAQFFFLEEVHHISLNNFSSFGININTHFSEIVFFVIHIAKCYFSSFGHLFLVIQWEEYVPF